MLYHVLIYEKKYVIWVSNEEDDDEEENSLIARAKMC
jgi:hypothetical protein